MIFACRTPHTPAPLPSRTDGLDMKVSTRQKQGATRHNRAGAKGDNSASCAPEGPPPPVPPPVRPPIGPVSQAWGEPPRARTVGAVREPPAQNIPRDSNTR